MAIIELELPRVRRGEIKGKVKVLQGHKVQGVEPRGQARKHMQLVVVVVMGAGLKVAQSQHK